MKRILATAIALLIIALLLTPLAGTMATGEERSRTDERRGGDDREGGDEDDGDNGDDERNDERGDGGEDRDDGDGGATRDDHLRRRDLGNPPPQPNDNDEPRVLSYTTTNTSVTVVSSGKTDGNANSFYLTAELNNGIVLHYSFFRETGSDYLAGLHRQFSENRNFLSTYPSPGRNGSSEENRSSSSPEDLGLSIAFSKLREINGTGSEVSSKDLSRFRYTRPQVRVKGPEANPSEMLIRLGTTNGLFGVTIRIHSNYTSDESGIVGPLEVKFAITIRDYNFTGNDSFLVLETSLDLPDAELDLFSRELLQQIGGPDSRLDGFAVFEEDGVGYEKDAASLFLSWGTNVTVDHGEYNVSARYARTLGSDRQLMDTMYFFYPTGSFIHHDPKIGVAELIDDTEKSDGDTIETLLIWSTGLAAGIVTMFIVGVKLKPKKYHWEE